MEKQKAEARRAWKGSGEAATEEIWFEVKEKTGATDFLGYDTETAEGEITTVIAGGNVLKNVRALLMAPDRRLWIASKKTKSAVALEPSGKMGASLAAQEPRTLSLAPNDPVVLAAKSAVRVGPRVVAGRDCAARGNLGILSRQRSGDSCRYLAPTGI